MDVSAVSQIIGSLGFPIAVAIACFWYINKQEEQHKQEIDKIRYWTVKKGDTLGRIAYRTGVSVSKLCALNGITKNTVLRIGRKIRYT